MSEDIKVPFDGETLYAMPFDLGVSPNLTNIDSSDFTVDDSIEKVSGLYGLWRGVTEELIYELAIAKDALSGRGAKEKYGITFAEWCEKCGLPTAQTVSEWIKRWEDPDYDEKLKAKAKSQRESAVRRAVKPLIDKGEFTITNESKDAIEVEISIYGQTFPLTIKR